ncbi:hypothetical protein KUTeg_000708 [Tegillarca granosa]|uniref:Uncharacterized protein n=1 Tax=Tegillarca granosa TaxID=220873 RepID=A0ABQ9FYB4_TEGGR|nr:hypothetical protein KUTeg_000708 [Tegillarca granosa]
MKSKVKWLTLKNNVLKPRRTPDCLLCRPWNYLLRELSFNLTEVQELFLTDKEQTYVIKQDKHVTGLKNSIASLATVQLKETLSNQQASVFVDSVLPTEKTDIQLQRQFTIKKKYLCRMIKPGDAQTQHS